MSDAPPADQLRNRILGAVLLVVLAVLVIPLFLGEPKDQIDLRAGAQENSTPSAAAPTIDEEFQSKISRLPPITAEEEENGEKDGSGAATASTQAEQSSAKTVDNKNQTAPENGAEELSAYANQVAAENGVPRVETIESGAKIAKPASEQITKAAPAKTQTALAAKQEPTNKPTPTTKLTPAADRGWALQVGIFSKALNAKGIAESLKAHGMMPHLSKFTASFGPATRVWLGPYASKTEARTASRQLESKTGNKGYVTELPFKTK